MNEITYDALMLAMTRAIRSTIAYAILNNKPAEYFSNRTGMLLADITNNLDTYDAVLSNLSKYREFDPKYIKIAQERILELEIEAGYMHLRKRSIIKFFVYLTHVGNKNVLKNVQKT